MKWKAGKNNHSLLQAKANKFSRNALIDSKPPAVTAHNTAFKSSFTIMPKFLKRTFRADTEIWVNKKGPNASHRDTLQWFLGKFYEPDPHKVVICIEQNCRPYPRKCRFARAVAVKFSNRWPSDEYRGYKRESELG